MTANVKIVLNKIGKSKIFDDIYFTGGTALSYYLNHRISEDIDLISSKKLNYKSIISQMTVLGAKKVKDEHEVALKMAGLFPDEYIIKFILDGVKIEFFYANRPIQQEILSQVDFKNFQNLKLKILDIKSIAKLKLVALVLRNKSRDLFDFGIILERNIFDKDELIEQFLKIDNKLNSFDKIVKFIKNKKEPYDDEAVYLSETKRVDLSFDEIKDRVLEKLKT